MRQAVVELLQYVDRTVEVFLLAKGRNVTFEVADGVHHEISSASVIKCYSYFLQDETGVSEVKCEV